MCGMIERGDCARFAPEAVEPIDIARDFGRQDLQRDITAKSRIGGTIHGAHSAFAKLFENPVERPSRTPGSRDP